MNVNGDDLRRKIERAVHDVAGHCADVDVNAIAGRVLSVVSGAHARSWPAENGDRTIYVRVGCWQEGNRIYAAMPAGRDRSGGGDVPGALVSYVPGHPEYAALRAQLERWGRWSDAAKT